MVNAAAIDPRTLTHPLVRGELGVRFYAAAPIITTDGHQLGTVTALDTAPRELSEGQTMVLTHLSALAADQLQLRLNALHAVRAERELRAEAEQRGAASAGLSVRLRAAAEQLRDLPHPETCQLGGGTTCLGAAELKIADSWGDSAWGCTTHVEEAIINMRSVFIANEEPSGVAAYRHRQ